MPPAFCSESPLCHDFSRAASVKNQKALASVRSHQFAPAALSFIANRNNSEFVFIPNSRMIRYL
jgi:hypothetical protein